MSNPYQPPSSRVADPKDAKGSRVKAIAVGLFVDIGGSIGLSIVLSIIYGIGMASSGATSEQIAASFKDLPLDSWVSVVGLIGGTFFSGLGGYVCARIAKHLEFALGAILAALSITVGLIISADHYSALLNVAMAIATFVAVMIGARIGMDRNASPQ